MSVGVTLGITPLTFHSDHDGCGRGGGSMDIVYRVAGESVVFAVRGRAQYVAHIWKALEESKTWGELRRNLPDGECRGTP
jgi:hypothetical protein